MKLTNRYKLPQTLINLHEKQRGEYAETKADADISVTQLIRSPRIDLLRKKHFAEMSEDISERLWAVLGTVIHKIMEEGADEEHIAEENLFATIKGWKVKGGIDVTKIGNRVAIIDYKFTKAYKYQKGDFLDWEEQLNCYAYLLREARGIYADELTVVMFVRDFAQGLAGTQKDYPAAPSIPVPIKLWTADEQLDFILKKVDEHQDARRAFEWGDPLPHCTDRDRWIYPGRYAVQKPGAARATKTFDEESAAKKYMKGMKTPSDYEVVLRQKAPVRCSGDYCGVAKWCDQWQSDKSNWKED